MRPLLGGLRPASPLSTADYLQLLDWTDRHAAPRRAAPGKRGRIAQNALAILSTIDRDPDCWRLRVPGFGSGRIRAVRAAPDLIAMPERIGQQ
jgi:hypothetical protein